MSLHRHRLKTFRLPLRRRLRRYASTESTARRRVVIVVAPSGSRSSSKAKRTRLELRNRDSRILGVCELSTDESHREWVRSVRDVASSKPAHRRSNVGFLRKPNS